MNGMTHIRHDKQTDLWYLVHTTNLQYPMDYKDGVLKVSFTI